MPIPAALAAYAAKRLEAEAIQQGAKHAKKLPVLFAVVLLVLALAVSSLLAVLRGSDNAAISASSGAAAALYVNGKQGESTPVVSQCVATGVPVSTNAFAMPAGPASPYDALYAKAAATFPGSLDSTTLKSQAVQESGQNPNARNARSGAAGIIQFMPATWAAHGIDGDGDGKRDILNPADNIMSSAKYSAELARIVSDVPGDRIANILAAYNAGPGNVLKYNGIPPFAETRNYVTAIPARVASWGASVSSATAACNSVVPAVTGDWTRPLAAACKKTSPFGNRGAIAGVHGARFHAGQDCGVPIGTPLFAVTAGTLTQKSDPGGYGTYYTLTTGNLTVVYGHMSKLELPTGTQVVPGQRIGLSGNTGGSSGPHLHFEVRVSGKPTEPVAFMAERGVSL